MAQSSQPLPALHALSGQAQRTLVVWNEGSVRSPLAAAMLVREGCVLSAPPSARVESYLRVLSRRHPGIFDGVSYREGRVVVQLEAVQSEALRSARRFALTMGLSGYEPSVGTFARTEHPRFRDLTVAISALSARETPRVTLQHGPSLLTISLACARAFRLEGELFPRDSLKQLLALSLAESSYSSRRMGAFEMTVQGDALQASRTLWTWLRLLWSSPRPVSIALSAPRPMLMPQVQRACA